MEVISVKIYPCVQYYYVLFRIGLKLGFLSWGAIRSGHETDHSLPSEHRVYMNGAILLFPPPLCFDGVHRDNFVFSLRET